MECCTSRLVVVTHRSKTGRRCRFKVERRIQPEDPKTDERGEKAQEELGNPRSRNRFSVDRAANLSESTSKVTKPAPDVSPSATSRYANELRLKKTELSVKGKSVTPARGKAADSDLFAGVEKASIAKISPRLRRKSSSALKTPKTRAENSGSKSGWKELRQSRGNSCSHRIKIAAVGCGFLPIIPRLPTPVPVAEDSAKILKTIRRASAMILRTTILPG